MLSIFTNMKLIAGVAGVALLLFVGYSFGARRVDSLEAQIASIKRESEDAANKQKKSQEEMNQILKQREDDYAKQAEQLKADAERKEKELTVALSGANSRVASLQKQMSALDVQRAELVTKLNAAAEADRKKLQDQIDKLDREKQELAARAEANVCLTLVVPEEVIAPLMGSK